MIAKKAPTSVMEAFEKWREEHKIRPLPGRPQIEAVTELAKLDDGGEEV